jgi:hypothetical protein
MTTPPDGPDRPGHPGQPSSPGQPAGQSSQPQWQSQWQSQWQPQWQPQGQPQGGYAPVPPPGYGYGVPDHPRAQTSLILGILGLVLCQVAAPFAWVTGKRTVNEIDASRGMLGGRSQAQTGYVLGIVGTVILGLGVAFMLFYFVVLILMFDGMAATSP